MPPSEEEIRDRIEDSGAQSGEIEITLLWDTTDDLDLHCFAPDGSHIYHKDPDAGGGKLDVDRNREGTTLVTNPIEHIFFEHPENGQYKVYVRNYQERTPSREAHATVRIQIGNTVESYEEVFKIEKETINIATFEYNGGSP